ncbi:DEAD-domain-containing protein [Agrocybe pediades]|nr:DEAD-domain-containing protein [Agrocybe pediades]
MSTGAAAAAQIKAHPVDVQPRSASPNNRHFSEKRFADAPISNGSKSALKYEFMSDVQAATLDLALSGKDLLVQAKTGTGKTIAFLLPAIERLLKAPRHNGISILVLAPTRELALQIEKEAEMLLQHHPFKVQHAIGGTKYNTESNRILRSPCDILIATPGRLLDHLRSPGLKEKLSGLRTIVYDEADRLLDAGFSKDLDQIINFLPPRNTRQALLFSATVSEEIKKVAAGALRPGYSFVSTLLEDEVNTHEHVEQTYIITSQQNFMQATIDVLMQDLKKHSSQNISTSKCMVFFPTARQVAFATELLSQIPGLPPILEIHSRKSQPARIKAATAFKDARSAVLLSSDVAARGVDFPGVTLVLQVGLPANSEQYIHRLGRTARAGAAGRGIMILSPEEQFFLSNREVAEFGLKADTPPPTHTPIAQAIARVSSETKAQAYRAFLGYYNGYTKPMKMTKAMLVQWAWEYAKGALGWPESGPPTLESRTVGKMGLKGVPGIAIDNQARVSKKAVQGGNKTGRQPRANNA